MNKYIISIILLLIVVAGGYLLTRPLRVGQYNYTMTPAGTSSTTSPSGVSGTTLFSTSPDYSSAVQIFPGTLSDKAKLYLENFDMTSKNQSDGSTQVTLTPKDGNNGPQQYMVKAGQTLYFVEKFPGDDAADTDTNIKDDYGVIVDVNGYIVTP